MDLRVPSSFKPEVRLGKLEKRFTALKSGERHNALYGLGCAAYDAGHKEFDDLHRYLVGVYEQCAGGADYGDCEATARKICDNYKGEAAPVAKAKQKAVKAPDSHLAFWRKWCDAVMENTNPVESDGSIDTEEKVDDVITSSVLALCIDKDADYFAGTIYNDKSASAFFTPSGGDFNACLPPSQYICLNPLSGRKRDIEHCKHVDYLLLEMDEPIAESKNEKGTEAWLADMLDQQCRFWSHVIAMHDDLPIACLTYSGGKSVHAQIAVDATPEELERHRESLSRLYAELHFDTANIDPVRKSRIPGGLRSYIVGTDGYMMDEMKEFDALMRDVKSKNKERSAMAKAKLDAHGINWYHPNKTCVYQDCLMIRPGVRHVSLDELEILLQNIIDEFLPTSENAFEEALARHDHLPMTQSNFEDYLAYKKARIYTDDIMRRPVCTGFDKNDINIISKDVMDDWYELAEKFPTVQMVEQCIAKELALNKFNPVTDWLDGLTWDGVDRMPIIYDILGIGLDELSKTLTRNWLIQCVAMAYNDDDIPYGADGVLTLLGRQGIGKTSFFRNLLPKKHQADWFYGGMSLDTDSKDDLLKLTTGWIKELGEVDSTTRKEQSSLKAVITAESDDIRKPYEKRSVRSARHVSLCATVNKDDYLRDITGNRRWWTVPVARIDYEKMNTIDVEQLWAQMKTLFKSGEEWRIQGEDAKALEERNAGKRIDSGYEDTLRYIYDFEAPAGGWSWKFLNDIAIDITPDSMRTLDKGEKTILKNSLTAINVDHRVIHKIHQFRMPPLRDKTARERMKEDGEGF